MGESNLTAIRAIKESTVGTTPASPAFRAQCHKGASLSSSPDTVRSERICGGSSRGIKDLTKVGETIGDGHTFEYYFGCVAMYQEGVFRRAWSMRNRRVNTDASDPVDSPASNEITAVSSSVIVFSSGTAFAQNDLVYLKGWGETTNNGLFVASAGSATSVTLSGMTDESAPDTAEIHNVGVQGATGDIVATTSGGNALTSTTLNFTTLGLAAGDWIVIGDANTAAGQFATAACNGWARLSAVAANRLSFDRVPSGFTGDAGSGKTIRLFFGDKVWDGATEFGYSIEEDFQDMSPQVYQYFRGMQPGRLTLGGSAKSILEGEVSFFGMSAEITETRFSGASSVSDPNNDSMNTSSNVGRIAEFGSPIASPVLVRNASIEIDNGLRRKDGWGVTGAGGISAGDFAATVSAELFFENKAVRERVINNTETSFEFIFVDGDSQAEVYDFPRGKYEDGQVGVPGRNQDNTIGPRFLALEHATLGYTCKHQRFFHAPAA